MFKRALFALCFSALLASHASAAVTFISSCGITITEPGQYHLSQDLNCTGPLGNAITIAAPDVQLHFAGHKLDGSNSNMSSAGVLVLNCAS